MTDGVIIALTRFERFDSKNRHSRFGGGRFQVKQVAASSDFCKIILNDKYNL